MSVALAPPLHYGSPWAYQRDDVAEQALRTGPAFVRARTMTRWHRVRSAVYRLTEHDGGQLEESTCYHFWCGQYASTGRRAHRGGLWTTDIPPDGEPLCGTCMGRAIGADPERPEWIFSPANLDLPKVCPGGTARGRAAWPALYAETDRWNRLRCLVCGDVVPGRGSGGPYRSIWGLQSHEPGPGLVDPCPFHGWRELTVRNGVAACRCGVSDTWTSPPVEAPTEGEPAA